MPYLSRMWINPLRQGAQKLLGNPQAMRAAVLGGIPVQPVQERVLWRLDTDEPRRPALLVLTQTQPSWEHLVEQAGWPATDEGQAQVRDYAPLLAQLERGRLFAFRLTANPVKATKQPDKLTPAQDEARERDPQRSAIVGHRTVAHQLQWLLDRVTGWGARIPPARTEEPAIGSNGDAGGASPSKSPPDRPPPPLDVRVSGRQRLSFQRKGAGRVTLQQVTYEGHLVVEDANRLRDVLFRGVGKGKAYGCGLLTLAPSTRPG